MDDVKTYEVKIGDRKIPLLYSTYELIEIQKEIGCTGFQLKDEVFGLKQLDEDDPKSTVMEVAGDPVRMEKLGKLIRIMGNAGLEQRGEEADLTDKWVLRNMKPAMVLVYAVAVMGIILEGNQMESTERDKDGEPVDEILEAENAKKQPGS